MKNPAPAYGYAAPREQGPAAPARTAAPAQLGRHLPEDLTPTAEDVRVGQPQQVPRAVEPVRPADVVAVLHGDQARLEIGGHVVERMELADVPFIAIGPNPGM